MELEIEATVEKPRVIIQGFSMLPEVREHIETMAEYYGINKSNLVTRLVEQHFDYLKKKRKLK